MRIAGNTIRRNYLSRYEKNYSDKYGSEKKLYSGRQFDRASENPINAARALRIRKTQAEVETYQANLKTADSVYTIAETSMLQISSIIQNVYEKLVEGAHGTRNQDDLNILALEVDNYAEEMVQSLNVDVADRKVFGGLNNDTSAFKIETSAVTGEKFVTYNGVSINTSSDPQSYPYNGTSYLDIGMGMSVDGSVDRIDDQTALPITFNGAECTGCGVTGKTAMLDLSSLIPGRNYEMDITAGGTRKNVNFTAVLGREDNVAIINEALKTAFREAPEIQTDGSFSYAGDDYKCYTFDQVNVNNNAIDLTNLKPNTYYSLKVTLNNKTRVINFEGGTDDNDKLQKLDNALREQFGDEAYADGNGEIHLGSKYDAVISRNIYSVNPTPMTADGKVDIANLEPGKEYTINLNKPKLGSDGLPMKDENGDTIYDSGQMISFKAVDDGTGALDINGTVSEINKFINDHNIYGNSVVPTMTESGVIMYDVDGAVVTLANSNSASSWFEYSEVTGYPKNIMQLVLDAGKFLREGNQDMVARYADLIYAAQSNLSIAITDLGTHSKFIEFNEDRLSEIQINLNEKQNDIESTDMPSEITNWKVLESVYNASLQMGASILSQSIFNYIS